MFAPVESGGFVLSGNAKPRHYAANKDNEITGNPRPKYHREHREGLRTELRPDGLYTETTKSGGAQHRDHEGTHNTAHPVNRENIEGIINLEPLLTNPQAK